MTGASATGATPAAVATFVVCLILFTAVGVLSARRREASSADYLVASRAVKPWLIALSAVSTNNSGYMFIGLIGFAWREGVVATWITVGWVLGDWLTWRWAHVRVRRQSAEVGATSVPSLLARDPEGGDSRLIAGAAGLLTLLFLGGYAAAQLRAGSVTLHVLFDWPMWTGATVGALIIAMYSLAGGIRASIWTDAAQSIAMLLAMGVLLATCMSRAGGPTQLMAHLHAIDPQLTSWMPSSIALGFGLYALGFIAGGAATVAQPHITVRFMALDKAESVPRARRLYFLWYTAFSAAALAVGLYSRVLLPELGAGLEGAQLVKATESALPELSLHLLPPSLVGLMLAGIFAAAMSTADSQLLACSAALTQDLFPRWRESYLASKMATISVATVAWAIALFATAGVLTLVLGAWSILSASLGPVLLVRLARKPLATPMAITMMTVGILVVVAWDAAGLSSSVYPGLPGMLVPLVVYALWRAAARRALN